MALLLPIGFVIGALTADAWASCSGCGSGQTVICGCDLTGPGQVVINHLDGNPNGSVIVDLMIHANTIVQAFTIDIHYPGFLVTGSSVAKGNLTQQWTFFNATIDTAESKIIVGGFTSGSGVIMPGVTGTLAKVNFAVDVAGCGSFGLANPTGHIVSYTTCPSGPVSAPSVSATEGGIRVLGLPGDARRVVYGLKEAASVSLDVVDVRGRVVDRLVGWLQPAGSYAIPLHTESYGSGVYLVRLKTGLEVSAKVHRRSLMRLTRSAPVLG
jgi:hypothetical protein